MLSLVCKHTEKAYSHTINPSGFNQNKGKNNAYAQKPAAHNSFSVFASRRVILVFVIKLTIKVHYISFKKYTFYITIMTYNVSKLADFNSALATEVRNQCYPIVGLCQQVHREMGPFLNEYMYQEALDISLEENGIEKVKEYYFSVTYHGRLIRHKHYADFLVNNSILIECKAVERLGTEHRQQLWNYMRLTKICIGILYNFAPVHDQCERYFLDKETGNMYMF